LAFFLAVVAVTANVMVARIGRVERWFD